MTDDLLNSLTDDERAILTGAVETIKANRRNAGQNESQARLREAYDAEVAKIQGTGPQRVMLIADLKAKYRKQGLEIW
jgi:hypothetical protein